MNDSPRPRLTRSVEDYLKTIYSLTERGESASTSALAEALDVQPASVTGMVKRLAECGYLEHARYHGVTLTETGQGEALRIIRRHRILETYLYTHLEYSWDDVHQEAERLEHAASDTLIDRMASILDHPGVESIRDIRGVWDRTEHSVGGFALTLDQIEHNLLRPFFRDPRIHFVLNCASSSCAALPPWAYSGESLEEQIEQSSKAFLQDLGNVRLEGSSLLLSRYFDWYASDFVEAGWRPRADSVADFVALYATPTVAEAIQSNPQPAIRFLDYDWSLNAARP